MPQADGQTLRARWVFPVDRPPLAGGLVTVRGQRIEAVEPAGARRTDVDLGEVAILPGFVNAHVHLDLSDARGKIPPDPDFPGWLRRVIEHRRDQTPEIVYGAIRQGIAEALRLGTTLVGDIAAHGLSWAALATAPVRAVVFRELLGLAAARTEPAWLEHLHWHQQLATMPMCRPGVSPHAPYSVSQSLIRWASASGQPVAIHLAETIAELDLLARHTGPFVPFLQELGVWEPEGLAPSVDWIVHQMRSCPAPLFVHGNYLPADTVLPAHAALVYCPRTHAAFGHPPHPFRTFLERGVRVALGTDSLASSPDLDILAEARFVAAHYPDVAGATILRMLTLSGAEALGWADVAGSLSPGKSADLVVLPLPRREEADPHRLVLESTLPVARVMFRGAWRTASENPENHHRGTESTEKTRMETKRTG